jgi:glycine betaine/choline ABC-type transport system substrate-binding protein
VALLFTTDPAIRARHLVVLADNHDLQPAENIVPVFRRATAHRFGPGLLAALNALSSRLSAAERWLAAQGLAVAGRGAR